MPTGAFDGFLAGDKGAVGAVLVGGLAAIGLAPRPAETGIQGVTVVRGSTGAGLLALVAGLASGVPAGARFRDGATWCCCCGC